MTQALDYTGANGYVDEENSSFKTRMDENFGYYNQQVARNPEAAANNKGQIIAATMGTPMLMKFKIASSGLLSQDKFLPVMAMPLTIQLRLSDSARISDKGLTGFEIKKARMHVQMLSVSQAYAAAMRQRLRGPGITLNYKSWDTFFQIVTGDKQIVVPSNKQRLSKVWVMFLDEGA